MSEFDGIEHVNLTVRDVKRTAAWYSDLFRLPKVWEEDSPEKGWHKIGLGHVASGLRLNFTEHRSRPGDTFSEFRTGLDHIAFKVTGGRAGLETWLARLAERGIAHSPVKRAVNGDVITIRDPDNIQVEIYALPE
jgi:glyoxylase I family protein